MPPQRGEILHHRPLSVKAKTSRAVRKRPARALTAKGRRCVFVTKGGIPSKPACAGFCHCGRRARFPESAVGRYRREGRAHTPLCGLGNASHRETHFLQAQHEVSGERATNYSKTCILLIRVISIQIQSATGSKIFWMPLRKPDISSTQYKDLLPK